jgi:hypothetical protein
MKFMYGYLATVLLQQKRVSFRPALFSNVTTYRTSKAHLAIRVGFSDKSRLPRRKTVYYCGEFLNSKLHGRGRWIILMGLLRLVSGGMISLLSRLVLAGRVAWDWALLAVCFVNS